MSIALMDPFSITIGVAGLLRLTIQIIQVVNEYVEATRGAPQEAKELIHEFTTLESVLNQLEAFFKGQHGRGRFKKSSVIHQTATRCSENLTDLKKILDKFVLTTTKESKLWRKFCKWPFTRKKHRQVIQTLQGYVKIFHCSMDIDGW